jgi:hypothetical protein
MKPKYQLFCFSNVKKSLSILFVKFECSKNEQYYRLTKEVDRYFMETHRELTIKQIFARANEQKPE